jgi:hypothetical protein
MSTIHRFLGDPTNDRYTWEGVGLMDRKRETEDWLLVPSLRSPVFGLLTLFGHPPRKGKVQIKDAFYELGPLDAIFISGGDIHQLTNIGETPLGFQCLITRQAEYA